MLTIKLLGAPSTEAYVVGNWTCLRIKTSHRHQKRQLERDKSTFLTLFPRLALSSNPFKKVNIFVVKEFKDERDFSFVIFSFYFIIICNLTLCTWIRRSSRFEMFLMSLEILEIEEFRCWSHSLLSFYAVLGKVFSFLRRSRSWTWHHQRVPLFWRY